LIDPLARYSEGIGTCRILSSEEGIFQFFEEMIPVISGRAKEKKQHRTEFDPVYLICIPDMEEFLALSYEGSYDMAGFLENIWEKGSGLGIVFAAIVSPDNISTVEAYQAFRIFTGYRKGLAFERSLSDIRIFPCGELDYRDQSKAPDPGRGFLFADCYEGEKVVLPCLSD